MNINNELHRGIEEKWITLNNKPFLRSWEDMNYIFSKVRYFEKIKTILSIVASVGT